MSIIVTRASKGSILTSVEMDANLNNLNADKIESNTAVTVVGNIVAYSTTGGRQIKVATAAEIVAAIGATAVANATNAAYSAGLTSPDLRSVNLTPGYFGRGINAAFMQNTTDGLADGGTYHGVLSFQPYSDASGGGAYQLGFTDSNNLWIRGSSGALTSWAAWKLVLDSANYTSYAPTLTGSGASGTWGISISGSSASCSGNAATATNAVNLTGFACNPTSGTPVDTPVNSSVTYGSSLSLFGQIDGALYSHVYSASWIHQIVGDYRTGQLAIRGKSNGVWQAWRTVLDSTNYTGYSPSLTGVGASGSWGINVTGTATSLATARTIDGVSFDGTANITVIAPATVAATTKTTPVDADLMPLVDSAASYSLASMSWSAINASIGVIPTSRSNTRIGDTALQANTTGTNNTASGQNALRLNTTGDNNTASGQNALRLNTTGTNNTASGQNALASNTTGNNNTASGQNALRLNTTGFNNTASGVNALTSNTTGIYNTASGQAALASNTTGNNNTASGQNALHLNTTGGDNTANGQGALQENTTGFSNTASGVSALTSNTTGIYNTASGQAALLSNTTGNYNTASGQAALLSNTTGGGNTASGVNALASNITGSNNTASGQDALTSNTIGNYNTASGAGALQANTTGSGNTAINPLSSAGSYAPVFDPTTQNNRICMGSTSVTNAYIQVAWTVVSDARDKTDFAPVPHGLEFVKALKPTAYRYKMTRADTEGHGPVRYGFKAQEVLALEGSNPVIVDAEDAEKLRFNDQAMIAVLVNALQELSAKFDAYVSTHP